MKAATETSLSARDRQIATLLYAGDLDCEQIAERVGVSGRFIRYVAAGEKCPGVKAHVDCLRRETERREGCKLVQARLTALDRLVEALDAVKPDGTPDYAIRTRAATVLRTRKDETEKEAGEGGTEVDVHFVQRITSTIEQVIRDHPRLYEGIRGGRWANTHDVGGNGPVDRHR